MDWKLPPKEKIYEAFSVIADTRYEMIGEGKAIVTSSGGDKRYTVTWTESGDVLKISSNDNASKWQGYTGYPIIAILMITEKIRYNKDKIHLFKAIPWNLLNKKYKNVYSDAVKEILDGLTSSDSDLIREDVDNIMIQLSRLKLIR